MFAGMAPQMQGLPTLQREAPHDAGGGVSTRASWSPYDQNGGTVVAVAGADFVVVAGDTRLSTGFSILTREYSKLKVLNPNVVMASGGFQGDVIQLQKVLTSQCVRYKHDHARDMSIESMKQLLSNTMYYKRFFPYLTNTIIAGIGKDGKGMVVNYDPVGSAEATGYYCAGSGSPLLVPVLDQQLKAPSPLLVPQIPSVTALTEAEVVDLIKDCFATAGERDIYTGDKVEIIIVRKEGMRTEWMDLKQD